MYMSKMFVLSKLLPPSAELQNIFCCCWFVLKLFLVCTLFKIAVVSFGFVPYLAQEIPKTFADTLLSLQDYTAGLVQNISVSG